jgi:hypothetical protein
VAPAVALIAPAEEESLLGSPRPSGPPRSRPRPRHDSAHKGSGAGTEHLAAGLGRGAVLFYGRALAAGLGLPRSFCQMAPTAPAPSAPGGRAGGADGASAARAEVQQVASLDAPGAAPGAAPAAASAAPASLEVAGLQVVSVPVLQAVGAI